MEIKLYKDLLDYYKKELDLIDCIHFNSKVTENVYKQHLKDFHSLVLPITHYGIKDNRKIKSFSSEHISIMFVGNTTTYKGFPLLKEILMNLYNNGYQNWELSVWGGSKREDKDCPLINHKGKYTTNEIENIYEYTDLLIVPSIWKETFSLVTLEAISYGVPVLVSQNVGAKDIIARYDDYFIYNNKIDLYDKLKSIFSSVNKLTEFNNKINSSAWQYSMEQHAKDIEELLYKPLLKN